MRREPQKPLLPFAVRYVLPAGLALTGVVLLLAADGKTSEAIAKGLIGAAVMVVVANLFILMSLAATRKDQNRSSTRRDSHRPGI